MRIKEMLINIKD